MQPAHSSGKSFSMECLFDFKSEWIFPILSTFKFSKRKNGEQIKWISFFLSTEKCIEI